MAKSTTPQPFGKIGQPATRALANAGIYNLEQLSQWTEKDFLKLHGVGQKATGILKLKMEEAGLTFKQ